MRSDKSARARIAREAGRLMAEEGIGEYLTAKRLAARRVLRGRHARLQDLPSNREIRAALDEITRLAEGPRRQRRLVAMRLVALQTMVALEGLEPRLIGSVASGSVRRGSDIDLHVFPGSQEALETHLHALGWEFEVDLVLVRATGGFSEYTHVYLERGGFHVELSVYAPSELRVRTRSSVTGQPIDRVTPSQLRALLATEHPEAWLEYQRTRQLPVPEEEQGTGPFAGLLEELLAQAQEGRTPTMP